MKLLLERTTYTDKSTIGKLYINGVFQCSRFEDKDRQLEQDISKRSMANLLFLAERTKSSSPTQSDSEPNSVACGCERL